MASPTAVAAHTQATKTVTYTFSEAVKLVNETTGLETSMADIQPSQVQIYAVTAGPTWGQPSVPGITVETAHFTGNVLTLTYGGNLSAGDYVVDTWDYKVNNLTDEVLTENADLVFTASHTEDPTGGEFVDFVWGNMPMQPDTDRGSAVLDQALDSHEIAGYAWNGFPGYEPNTRGTKR